MGTMVERLEAKMAPGPHVALAQQSGRGDTAGDGRAGGGAGALAHRRAGALAGGAGTDDDLARHAGLFDLASALLQGRRGGAARAGRALGLAGLPGGERCATVLRCPTVSTPIQPIPSPDPKMREFIAHCCTIMVEAEADLNALGCPLGRRRYRQHPGHGGAGADRGARQAAAGGPHAALPRHRAGTQPDHGRLVRVLLAIFFAAAGDASASGKDAVEALKAGLDRIQQVGGARPGDRTMIDALLPALEALPGGLDAAARAAREGADHTASITRAKAGRASYVGADKLAGHNDPGAEAVAHLLENLAAG